MQAIQSDAVSERGQLLAPTLLDALQALSAEVAAPGAHPELSAMVAAARQASPSVLPLLDPVTGWISGWSFDTPSGAPEEQPSAAAIADSQAALVAAAWTARFVQGALGDELTKL